MSAFAQRAIQSAIKGPIAPEMPRVPFREQFTLEMPHPMLARTVRVGTNSPGLVSDQARDGTIPTHKETR